jgi:hypothetical protein
LRVASGGDRPLGQAGRECISSELGRGLA